MRRFWPLTLVLLLPLLAGCFGAGGVPLAVDRLQAVRDQFEEIDRLSEPEVDARLKTLQDETAKLAQTKDRSLRTELSRKQLLLGYCWERRGDFTDAERIYSGIGSSEYGSVAFYRVAQVGQYVAAEAEKQAREDESPTKRAEAQEVAQLQNKQAMKALERAANYPVNTRVLSRTPAVAALQPGLWEIIDIRSSSYRQLDKYYRTKPSYHIFEGLVKLLGGAEKNASYILAIFVIAILAKLITTPLSAAQFRSMQAMQRLQPQIKKLQEKYKEDKQALAKAQMELFKEARINPLSSCLPMLIQMPILIWVYYGIRYFVYRFEGVHFLYINNLANPDVLMVGGVMVPGPLLLLYGVSMYFSQKLIATPAATPEQQQQQKMMAYMMPFLLVLILKSLPAAFILYWFLQNILMTGHQYLIMRSTAVPAAAGGPSPDSGQAKPAPSGPPPEAMDRLSRGSQRRKKKRR
jgi:YidC/Oxa1 family membrane protein insertase